MSLLSNSPDSVKQIISEVFPPPRDEKDMIRVDISNSSEEDIKGFFEELGGHIEVDHGILYRGMPECGIKGQISGAIHGIFYGHGEYITLYHESLQL